MSDSMMLSLLAWNEYGSRMNLGIVIWKVYGVRGVPDGIVSYVVAVIISWFWVGRPPGEVADETPYAACRHRAELESRILKPALISRRLGVRSPMYSEP